MGHSLTTVLDRFNCIKFLTQSLATLIFFNMIFMFITSLGIRIFESRETTGTKAPAANKGEQVLNNNYNNYYLL